MIDDTEYIQLYMFTAQRCAEGMDYRKLCGQCPLDCSGKKLDPLCDEESNSCQIGCFCMDGLLLSTDGQCLTSDQCSELRYCTIPYTDTKIKVCMSIIDRPPLLLVSLYSPASMTGHVLCSSLALQ